MRIKKDKILNTILILVVLLSLLFVYLGYCALYGHREQPRPADKKIELVIEPVARPYDWKDQLRELFNTPHTLQWKEIKDSSVTGYTSLLTRKIYLKINLYEPVEVVTYAHELTHLKYFTANETFTTYKSIIILYESGIPYFRYVALREANGIINNHGQQGTKYDCGWLLQQYFEKGE